MRQFPELEAYRTVTKNMQFEPLVIIAKTLTPVVNDEPLSIDGILAFAVVQDCMRKKFPAQSSREPWDIPLPLQLQERVESIHNAPLWCSSSLLPVAPEQHQTHYHKRGDNPYGIRVQQQSMGDKRPRRRPSAKAGQYMDYRIPITTTTTDRWIGQCIGNRDEIVRLLQYVQNLGKLAGQGYGYIGEWVVGPIPEFSFWQGDGKPSRPIPVDSALFRDTAPEQCNGVQMCGWTPPYWSRQLWATCVMPV